MQKNRQPVQQGDVLLIPVKSIPSNAKTVAPTKNRLVLAYGERTGHHHSFAFNNNITMFRDDGNGNVATLYLKITGKEAQLLKHLDAENNPSPDHADAPVEPGAWEVRNQQMGWTDADARPNPD